jgi:hypothetical protein
VKFQGAVPVSAIEIVAGVFSQTVVDPVITLVGLGFTVSVTSLDSSFGEQLPLTISLYLYPFMLKVAPVIVSDAFVAPEYTPVFVTSVKVPLGIFTCHLYTKLDPTAVAVNVVFRPSQTVLLVGSTVISGRSRTVIFLVNVAEVPQGLETVNVNV